MVMDKGRITIVMADDDPDDRKLTADAFAEARLNNPLLFVEDGEELLALLRRRHGSESPRGGSNGTLVLLDLNMPRKDGREALAEMKADPTLRHIPVVVLTTSKAEEDVLRSYQIGASSYIVKPVTFSALTDVVRAIGQYWFELVAIPPEADIRQG
jgi:CheY-like chemotaxis protein